MHLHPIFQKDIILYKIEGGLTRIPKKREAPLALVIVKNSFRGRIYGGFSNSHTLRTKPSWDF